MTFGPWTILCVAIVLEVISTSLLTASQGMTRWGYATPALAGYAVCFWLMASVITRIPVGIAYAVWSGVGIVAITIIGWAVFRQQLSLVQIACIGLIVAGAIGLNLTSGPTAAAGQEIKR